MNVKARGNPDVVQIAYGTTWMMTRQIGIFDKELPQLTKQSNILIACEESGIVTDAFIRRGFTNVWSCDLLPTSGKHPDRHIQGDALDILARGKWDMMIAFPPCTYLSNAGAARLFPQAGKICKDRYEKGLKGKEFFLAFFDAPVPYICIENPVHTHVFKMPKPTQWIQPYEFGHPYSKKTYLWLKGLPNLCATEKCYGNIISWVSGGSKDKKGNKRGQAGTAFRDSITRSKTFPNIAEAMAEQWGENLIKKEKNNG